VPAEHEMNNDGRRKEPFSGQELLLEIVEATSPVTIAQARLLFEEYSDSIGVDLYFQGFADEVASLPGKYVPPKGGLFIAFLGGQLAGCVALRPLEPPDTAELKRLYVRPRARGHGLGRSLTQRATERAVQAGYRRIRLDTLSTMSDAQRLYRQLGFKEIAAYTFNPLPGAIFMELVLGESGADRTSPG
jgi:ribosomal protein S18 acetylase RimI-like enzyme